MTEIKPDFEISADDAVVTPAPSVKKELTPEQRLWEMEDSLESLSEPFIVSEKKVAEPVETVEKVETVEPAEDEDDGIYIEPAETEEEAAKVIDLNDDIPVFVPTQEPLRTLEEQGGFAVADETPVAEAVEVVKESPAVGSDEMFEEETLTADEDASEAVYEYKKENGIEVSEDDSNRVIVFNEDSDEESKYQIDETSVDVPSEEPTYFLGGGDTLLAQIDAFREKAMQLATMINEKESKAKELENVVASYEEKNRLLEEELNAKQEEADALKTDVESQVNRMLASLKDDMDQMGVDITDRISACSMNINTDDITASVSDYFDSVIKTVNGAKDELVEKYHSENVRLYRNVQDLMKELDNSDEIILKSQQQYDSLKTRFSVVTGLLVLNFVIAVCVLILSLNIF